MFCFSNLIFIDNSLTFFLFLSYPYKDEEDIPFVRPATFQQPTYPQFFGLNMENSLLKF